MIVASDWKKQNKIMQVQHLGWPVCSLGMVAGKDREGWSEQPGHLQEQKARPGCGLCFSPEVRPRHWGPEHVHIGSAVGEMADFWFLEILPQYKRPEQEAYLAEQHLHIQEAETKPETIRGDLRRQVP